MGCQLIQHATGACLLFSCHFSQMKRLDPFAAIGASGVSNLEKLLEWFKQSRLDPNDPNNKDIVYMLSVRH